MGERCSSVWLGRGLMRWLEGSSPDWSRWSSAGASVWIEFTDKTAGVDRRVAGDGRKEWRCVVEEFCGKDVEGCSIVDVIPEGKNDDFEIRLFCGFGGFCKDR